MLHAEAGLHTDPRFCDVQDALVQISMLTSSLEGWLPPFLAARRAELRSLEDDLHEDVVAAARADGRPSAEAVEQQQQGALSPCGGALSPEWCGARR